MTFYEHLEVLARLIEKFSTKGLYPSLGNLARETNLSKRQIQRYIAEIRGFGFDLKYCKQHKGYQIDKEETALLPSIKLFFEAFKIYQISQQDKISNYIIFDKRQEVDAVFKELHQAIVSRFLVEITYKSFGQEEAFTTEIEPYLLKEYKNRWYVVAKNRCNQKIRTFALDRIQEIRLTAKKFTYPQENPAQLFNYCFGIFLPENPLQEPEDLLLLFTYEQASYIQSLPLHHSQKVVRDTGKGILVSLKVHYTYDLEMELRSFGDNVKIIAPIYKRLVFMKNQEKATLKLSGNSSFLCDFFDFILKEGKEIHFIGLGGAGSNQIESLYTAGVKGKFTYINSTIKENLPEEVQFIHFVPPKKDGFINTDRVRHLLYEPNDLSQPIKIPNTVMDIFKQDSAFVLLSGLGAYTGTLMTKELTLFLKEQEKSFLTLSVVPFNFEGRKKVQMAENTIKELENIDNFFYYKLDFLLHSEEYLTITKVFERANEHLCETIQNYLNK